jgi:phosphatidylserine decarboxylase
LGSSPDAEATQCLGVLAANRSTKGGRLDFRHKRSHVPFAREGVPYVLCAAFATLIMAVSGPVVLTWLSLVVTLLIGHFFRDPERVITADTHEVVSPADGKVIAIERLEEPCFTRTASWKISIFMSVFNVHVNRIPCSATVRGLRYQEGKYFAANRLKASSQNEQNWIWLQTVSGQNIVLTQVAGLIARRIVCWPTTGDQVLCGERFGLIRFGSRVDIYVPEGSKLSVAIGDRVCAGGSIICRLD